MRRSAGFTLIELMVTLGIVGMLASLAVPLAASYRKKAEYAGLTATLRYLMDGQEAYFIEHDSFYPAGLGSITVGKGQEKDIPELAYTFPAGHKHRYIITTINLNVGTWKLNYYWIYVYADFDRDGNGQNDLYIATTYFMNNDPITSGGTRYYRLIQQFQ
jgi:prepilin-type N-terminal cleavage/methylation domain-containing protein